MRLNPLFLTIKNAYSIKLRPCHFIAALLLLSFTSFGQTGINTDTPTTTLDVNGALSLRESPTAITLGNGANLDINLPGDRPYSQYRIEGPTLPFTIYGIQKVTGADGQIVRLINTTDQVMTIFHDGIGDEFKILCPEERNLEVGGINSSVTLQYSKGLQKWSIFNYTIASDSRYSVIATSLVEKKNSTPEDLPGLSITFTPKNSIVYVTYGVYGDINPASASARFHLLMNGDVVFNTQMRTASLGLQNPYRAILPMFPLSVTPGTPVTLKVQWWRGLGTGSGTLNNNPAQYPDHGRYITVID